MSQIQKVLKDALNLTQEPQYVHNHSNYKDETELALDETKAAIAKIFEGAESVELQPQNQNIRKLQHELVEAHNLSSVSIGEGEHRHLKVFKEDTNEESA